MAEILIPLPASSRLVSLLFECGLVLVRRLTDCDRPRLNLQRDGFAPPARFERDPVAILEPFFQALHRHIVRLHALAQFQPPAAADFKVSALELYLLGYGDGIVTTLKK